MRVAVVIGSKSDFETVKPAAEHLKNFGIDFTVRVISAHRCPEELHKFIREEEKAGCEVFIGAAGKAAHLAGVIAGYTALPVIAIPISTSFMGGLDSLLSMVQMPAGVPVATVAVNGSANAAILAAQILSIKYPEIKKKLIAFKEDMRAKVAADDAALQGGY